MNEKNEQGRTLVLATGNRDKQNEITALLSDLEITILTLQDFPGAPSIIEDGATCEENALKKARGIADFTKQLTLADDTGLEVEALGGRPGVYAARYAGEEASYDDNCQKLLRELNDVPSGQRQARFLTVIAVADSSGNSDVVEGSLAGEISTENRGRGGFGYDPVFFLPDEGKTLAEISAEHKNRISHRGLALQKAKELLKTKWIPQISSGRSAAR